MKRIFLRLLSITTIIVFVLSGCISSNKTTSVEPETQDDTANNEKMSIVCTIFPQYDWVKQVLGDEINNVDITLLLDNGVDLHSYQPTAEDIVKISEADLFIYVGGESDEWVDDVLTSANNKDMKVINLMEALNDTIKEEEVIEGMQGEDLEGTEEGHEEGEVEYDEHVWLSLQNAGIICNLISDALGNIDEVNAANYSNNCNEYTAKLEALDKKYEATVKNAARTTILFGDRFPFRYMVDDYGLNYYAAFVGCSAETEASFETITFLAGKVDELKLPAVLVIENSDQKIAQTIVSNTERKNQNILVMDSMQSVTSGDIDAGESYMKIMEQNLNVLKEVLN